MSRQDSGVFQKISLLSDLTNAMTSQELRDAFQALGANGDRLYEIFAEAVYKEIEFLMKGEETEAVAVFQDAAQSAQQVYAAMHSLYSMMVSLSNTPAMAPLNLIAERMTGQSFNPQAQQPQYQPQPYQAPQYAPPQQPAGPGQYPGHPSRRQQQPAPEPVYEEELPPEPAPPPPRRQAAPRPQPQQPAPAPQPPKKRQYSAPAAGQPAAPAQGQQPAPQRPGPAQTNRPAPIQGHTDPAPTLPPRRNRITGLF